MSVKINTEEVEEEEETCWTRPLCHSAEFLFHSQSSISTFCFKLYLSAGAKLIDIFLSGPDINHGKTEKVIAGVTRPV